MGVCHLDLKPENILFESGVVKITDFGNARVFKSPFSQDKMPCFNVIGSGPYASPEQFYRTGYDGPLADVWSCGVLYLVMVFKLFPWRMAIKQDVHFAAYCVELHLHYFDQLEDPTIVQGMLHPDPTQRLGLEQVMSSEWFLELS